MNEDEMRRKEVKDKQLGRKYIFLGNYNYAKIWDSNPIVFAKES